MLRIVTECSNTKSACHLVEILTNREHVRLNHAYKTVVLFMEKKDPEEYNHTIQFMRLFGHTEITDIQ